MKRTQVSDKQGDREYLWAVWVSLAIMAAASLPYLIGWGVAPAGYRFLGFTYNVDDACVYLSWMRQAADGHFFLRNLFTTEPQVGHGFNLLFFCLGTLARIFHLPLVAVFHIARVAFGLALLLAIYGVSGIWLKDVRSRRIGLLIAGLSGGLGWMFWKTEGTRLAVDLWQPEAITFLSVYLSPLYSFPTLLMIGSLYFLHRFTATGAWKYAVSAGLVLLVLANVHTYDLITLAIAWSLYSAYRLVRRPPDFRPIAGGALAVAVAVPTAAYQLYFYVTEPIFRARAAVTTLSPNVAWYLVGYGLLVPLAVFGVWRSLKDRRDIGLLVCWAAAGFIAAYLPVAFQRKLIMGTHIPLSLMATLGVVGLAGYCPSRLRSALPAIILVLMIPSNLCFMSRDVGRVASNEPHTTAHAPFVSDNEFAALAYLRAHAGNDDVILAPPGLAVLVPGFTGRYAYSGHWGETVDFRAKLWEVIGFYSSESSEEERRAFLRKNRIAYVLGYHRPAADDVGFVDFRIHHAPYLKPVFDTAEITVYRVTAG